MGKCVSMLSVLQSAKREEEEAHKHSRRHTPAHRKHLRESRRGALLLLRRPFSLSFFFTRARFIVGFNSSTRTQLSAERVECVLLRALRVATTCCCFLFRFDPLFARSTSPFLPFGVEICCLLVYLPRALALSLYCYLADQAGSHV